jgi:hypothetical protein
VVLAAALVVILVAVAGGGEDLDAQQDGSAVAHQGADSRLSASALADASATGGSSSTKEEEPPDSITLELTGLPDGGTVTLGGEPIEPPFEVPYSTDPTILKVAAPGFSTFEKALTPDRSHRISVELERAVAPTPEAGASSPEAKGDDQSESRSEKRKKKRRKRKGFADNPFG